VLALTPLRLWLTDEVTPLSPHERPGTRSHASVPHRTPGWAVEDAEAGEAAREGAG
jgi:hypothetical protein